MSPPVPKSLVFAAKSKTFHLLKDLRIWGNAEQVRSAKQQIETWVNLNKAPRKDWVKVYTFSEKKKRLLDKKMEDEAFEQSWRRHPKKGEFFGEQVSLDLLLFIEFVEHAFLL